MLHKAKYYVVAPIFDYIEMCSLITIWNICVYL